MTWLFFIFASCEPLMVVGIVNAIRRINQLIIIYGSKTCFSTHTFNNVIKNDTVCSDIYKRNIRYIYGRSVP